MPRLTLVTFTVGAVQEPTALEHAPAVPPLLLPPLEPTAPAALLPLVPVLPAAPPVLVCPPLEGLPPLLVWPPLDAPPLLLAPPVAAPAVELLPAVPALLVLPPEAFARPPIPAVAPAPGLDAVEGLLLHPTETNSSAMTLELFRRKAILKLFRGLPGPTGIRRSRFDWTRSGSKERATFRI
ncbi:MAG TPA: hypothetical protein VK745_17080, partial [Polyangiaceae bacterium]|nr:hypothetical protein [Polyangiaceae bacterium]